MPRPRRSESGFALLLVFLMAAVVSIMLYMEIPRAALQSQRNKEQLLMERGDQYKLAIRRFMQANKRWPASLDELESLNNRRFLRRRYKDPMTGKDEWRLIHIANGVLTDSKNSKQGDKDKKDSAQNNFVADMPGLGTAPVGGQGAVNMATRRRSSEGGTPPGTDPNAPGMVTTGGPAGQPLQPGQSPPGINGMPPVVTTPSGSAGMQTGIPGPQPGGFPGMPGAPVNSQTGGVSATPNTGGFVGTGGSFIGGGQAPGSQPNNPTGAQPVYAGQTPYPTAAGANGTPPGFPQPGATTGQANPAVGMINSLLTSPRPGGLAGIQAQNTMGGGAGIAGVASNLDADSIMTYADHTNYSEWEFVYDGRFVPPPPPNSGSGGTAVNQMGNMAGSSSPGTPIGGGMGGTQLRQGQQGQAGQQGGMGGMGMQGGAAGAGQNTNLNLRPGRQ
ncbi:MAG TPA: type II secretion system protein [Candidatus Sulfopaludibacter sp.]|jgi:type II secretory pathway pseudopilin PulG|nr:type II secretion system protein [Candidatus Sulfopaludibacter sp.]